VFALLCDLRSATLVVFPLAHVAPVVSLGAGLSAGRPCRQSRRSGAPALWEWQNRRGQWRRAFSTTSIFHRWAVFNDPRCETTGFAPCPPSSSSPCSHSSLAEADTGCEQRDALGGAAKEADLAAEEWQRVCCCAGRNLAESLQNRGPPRLAAALELSSAAIEMERCSKGTSGRLAFPLREGDQAARHPARRRRTPRSRACDGVCCRSASWPSLEALNERGP